MSLPEKPAAAATAFTVDFGPSEKTPTKKKLGLKDGIRHFAPLKRMNREKAGSEAAADKTSSSETSASGSGVEASPQPPFKAFAHGVSNANHRLGHNNNNVGEVDDQRYLKKSPAASLPMPLPIVAEAGVAAADAPHSAVDDACSDAGTYTIDNEDEEEAHNNPAAEETEERSKIDLVFDVIESKRSAATGDSDRGGRDWVSAWAETTCRTTLDVEVSGCLQGEHPDLVPESPRPSTASRSNSGETSGGKSVRRKLPATPEMLAQQKAAQAAAGAGANNTEAYLQDTLNVVAAMEARMVEKSSHASATPSPRQQQQQQTPPASRNGGQQQQQPALSRLASGRVKPKSTGGSGSKSRPSSSSAAAAAAREERKLAWERRKNYDPLKASGMSSSMTGALPDAHASHGAATTGSSFEESCYSDSCSELESGSLIIRENLAKNARSKGRSSGGALAAAPSASPSSSSSAKPNRAFALRQKLNQTSSGTSPLGPRNVSLSQPRQSPHYAPSSSKRTDSGLFNRGHLRSSAGSAGSGASPRPLQHTALKKTISDGRSTSSLSSREAEFQAWKRRKNYNPLRSVTGPIPASSGPGAPSSKRSFSGQPSPAVSKGDFLPNHGSSRGGAGGRAGRAPPPVAGAGAGLQQNMQRSASFHYPDGVSKIQHNVYTSEDDSCEEGAAMALRYEQAGSASLSPSRQRLEILEVDDDEFILPIGNGPSSIPSNSGAHHRPSSSSRRSEGGSKASSAGGGGSRMEALDNLVISTIFSISAKLCLNSASLIRRAQDRAQSDEQMAIMDTLLYVLEDSDLPASPSKKTSRELAGTLRNLKKVEQVLQLMERVAFDEDDEGEEGCVDGGGYDDDEDGDAGREADNDDEEDDECDQTHRL